MLKVRWGSKLFAYQQGDWLTETLYYKDMIVHAGGDDTRTQYDSLAFGVYSDTEYDELNQLNRIVKLPHIERQSSFLKKLEDTHFQHWEDFFLKSLPEFPKYAYYFWQMRDLRKPYLYNLPVTHRSIKHIRGRYLTIEALAEDYDDELECGDTIYG